MSLASNGIGPRAATALVASASKAGVEMLDLGRVRSAGVLGAEDNQVDAAGLAGVLSADVHRLRHVDLRHTGMDSRGALTLLAAAERATSPTRYLLGKGIAQRVKNDLRRLASDVPALTAHPDVAAIRSVHR